MDLAEGPRINDTGWEQPDRRQPAGRILLGLALLVLAGASAATPPITDPESFVAGVYRALAASSDHKPGKADYHPPEDIYTPRLSTLFRDYRRRTRGEAGCFDFFFWVNGQDWSLKNVRVTSREAPGRPDRRLVTAKFDNDGPQELEFEFQKASKGWLLDDVRSLEKPGWRLSELLTCRD